MEMMKVDIKPQFDGFDFPRCDCGGAREADVPDDRSQWRCRQAIKLR
jgi:hypothetical protein